jgi:hypothetical protein
MSSTSPLAADAGHQAITVQPEGPAAHTPAPQPGAVHALLDTLDPNRCPVRRAKWRHNLGAIVPSLALQGVAHIAFAATAGGTTQCALEGLAAAQIATSLGLQFLVVPQLPKASLTWTPNHCAASKWWLAGSALLGAGLTAVTQGPCSILATYGAFAGVYMGIGATMTLLGHTRKTRAQRAPQNHG